VEFPNQIPEEFISKSCYHMRSRGCIPVIAHPERCRLLELPKPGKSSLMERLITRDQRLNNSKCKMQNAKFHKTLNLEHGTLNNSSDTLLEYLMKIGCQFQGNIGSFAGIYGEKVRGRAVAFLREGLYSRLGTDAHSPEGLADWLDRGLREIEWDAGREGLTELLNGLPVETDSERQISVYGDLRF
jgi:protein-tyrosine phosphatase